jgi:uncharacterized DUF497 family protein
VEFTWDPWKDRLNRRKHRISFDAALHVFDDPYQVTAQDREVDGEPRWQTIGMVGANSVLLVAHTVDDQDGAIRIIRPKSNSHGTENLCRRQVENRKRKLKDGE